MSKGKYSPSLTREMIAAQNSPDTFIYTADGLVPSEWTLEMKEAGEIFDERIHFGDYDKEGYDSYGYSAFDTNGNYVGTGGWGVDRWGYSEMDYLSMSDEEFEGICHSGGYRR